MNKSNTILTSEEAKQEKAIAATLHTSNVATQYLDHTCGTYTAYPRGGAQNWARASA